LIKSRRYKSEVTQLQEWDDSAWKKRDKVYIALRWGRRGFGEGQEVAGMRAQLDIWRQQRPGRMGGQGGRGLTGPELTRIAGGGRTRDACSAVDWSGRSGEDVAMEAGTHALGGPRRLT
jgi:hypothetical protein